MLNKAAFEKGCARYILVTDHVKILSFSFYVLWFFCDAGKGRQSLQVLKQRVLVVNNIDAVCVKSVLIMLP